MDSITGGQLAAEALMERVPDYIFTLSGGHITPIYQYLEGAPLKLFDTRHEQAAVFMAEAWGRMTRRPGVAMVTAGPGFTNALSAIANARLANSPLLLISGCVGVEAVEKLDLQDMCQAPVIEPMVKKALVCHQTDRIPEFIDMAYRTAISGRPGPVYLELPVDVLNAAVNPQGVKKLHTRLDSRPVDLEQVDGLIEMIEAANQPVVIAGSGAWYSGAGEELKAFIEMTGLPAFTLSQGRGVLSDTHPLCFESALGIRPGGAMIACTSADLVIMLGSRINLYYMFGEIFDQNARFVQVDIEAEEIGRNRTIDLGIVGDVKALLKVVNARIGQKGVGGALKEKFSPWIDMVQMAHDEMKVMTGPTWESAEVPIHPMRLAKEVDDFMDREDDVVVADGGDTQIWMGMTRTVRKPGHYLDSGLYGCLGVGLPFANAAKLLNPERRVCLVTGDGSVGFNFMEFETALRHQLPVVTVISNDLGWGMIRHSQELRLGHAIEEGTYIGKVDYHKMVEAMGGVGLLVEKPEDIRPALEQAFASGKPACVNVMTDPTTISPGSIALANLGAYKA